MRDFTDRKKSGGFFETHIGNLYLLPVEFSEGRSAEPKRD